MNTLAPTFLIGFSSFLQVTRTVIRSRMISKFGEVEPWTAELAALERLKKKTPLTYNGRDVVDTPAPSFLILAGNKDSHRISDDFKIRRDSTIDCRVTCP